MKRSSLALILLGALSATSAGSAARLWHAVSPAAGVPIRSAANFRVFAISTTGTSSIDVIQVNPDGSSTRLDSFPVSTVGSSSAGTYVTRNMAAIYWQFTTPPAPSLDPPPVTVTFINDVPTIPLSALYVTALPQTPFAANDPSLLLNIDLRKGTSAGWTTTGSGTFDATNGYIPGTDTGSGTANTLVGNFASSTAMPQGSIAVRFQRTGVTTDDSFGTHFWDSTGNTLNATTQRRQLVQMRSNASRWSLSVYVDAAPIPRFWVQMQTNSMTVPYVSYWQTVNSHFVPGYHDPMFADLTFTWFQNQYYLMFDGHLFAAGTLGDVPIYQMFQNICIGNSNATGTIGGAPFGPYAIQQLQVSSRFLGPVLAGPTIGLLPDSFAAAYTQRNSPVATGPAGQYQISDVDAVQNALGLYSALPALLIQPGQTAALHQIRALMFRKYGFFPPIYNAGENGHGYSSINVPIDDAYIAALNKAAPSIVMAGGTVNDVSPFKPSDGNLIRDTESVMSRLVEGGGTTIIAPANPALEQIIYLETLSSQAMPAGGPYPEPAYATESQNIISLTRAQLTGFAPPQAVGFAYVASREWWNEASDYATYLYGSAPANPFNSPGGADYQNVHPDASGFSVIAAHLFGSIEGAVMNSAGADLSVTGTTTVPSPGSAVFHLSIANGGPLAAAGAVITGILPSGVTLNTAGSSNACTQAGNTVTCAIGTVAAGSSKSVAVSLQSGTGAVGAVDFAIAGTGGNDPNFANNVITLSPGFASSSGSSSDGPAPLWALGALGAALLGIAARRFEKAPPASRLR